MRRRAGAYQAVIDIPSFYISFRFFTCLPRPSNLLDVRTAGQIPHAVLVPEAKPVCGLPALWRFRYVLLSIIVSVFRREILLTEKVFLIKVIGTTVLAVAVGLILYFWVQRRNDPKHLRRDVD